MMLWFICAALVIIVGITIFLPFLRASLTGAEPAAAYDLRVYRDQLREVERDLERGVIEPGDAERLRIEIGRKVLEADRQLGAARKISAGPNKIWGLAALLLVAVGAFALYQRIGQPGLPDEPIKARFAAAEARYASRPSQAEAEAAAPKPALGTPDPDYLALIEKLREAMKERPDDPQGLALLAEHEARLGNFHAAYEAQAHLVAVRGDAASAEDHARLAALMVDAAGGFISAQSEAEVVKALQLDAKNGQALYMAGLLQIQNGRADRAFPIWANLLADSSETDPWTAPIRATITDLAWFAGEPNYTPPEAKGAMPALPGTALPGPDANAVAAAQDMTPEERQKMIESMVEGLESRLATEGGTPDEWARLISSLVILGKTDHARAIWQEAQTRFASVPQALELVNDAATKAGVK
ncbi:cytochrome c-type biogenesis protein CycH [Paracoccus aminophilus JCM 7686]|uniref:Cytochrome c-type biogenesis protein CycH n=2 Tax=Paracoccus aminophilus TaxID=34003 RepID=S5XQS8_PARAH|nr:cytochrome c-type biogenesis protein CycH [Paracoccus aminophilus JCM 7686]